MRRIKEPCGLHCMKVSNLGVSRGTQIILENISLHLHCGSFTAVIGRNGAGKSTLIRAILGDIPHTGTIEFKDFENGNLQKLKIGYVPQSINIEENSPLSVYDLFASYHSSFPLFLKMQKKSREEFREALKIFAGEDLLDSQVCKLSGGELQRVMLALAILDEPNLLLLDEPVSGVDQNGLELFYETIQYLKQNYDLSVILVSHDLNYVAKYADNVVLLDQKVLAEGSVSKVFRSDAFLEVFGEEKRIEALREWEKNSAEKEPKQS